MTPLEHESTTKDSNGSLSNWVLKPIGSANGANGASGGTAIVHQSSGSRHEYTFANSLIHGVPHPPFIQKDVWEAQRSQLTFRSDDIFISTFAKCGTTLAEQIVLLLLNGGKSEELNPLHKNTLDRKSGKVGKIWTEMAVVDGLVGLKNDGVNDQKACMGEGKARMSVQEFIALPSPRILKTHAPRELFLDQDKTAKVIYVTRNPFDACVSCYYHPKPGVSPQSNGVPFDAFCKLWLSERVEFGGWINHVKGWREEYQRSYKKDNMLWISYEQLVGQPLQAIQSIADFLQVDTTSDSMLVQRVAEGCKFDNVKKTAQFFLDNGAQGDISHLRKGKTGDWRTHFDEELFRQFEKEIRIHFHGDMDLEYDIGQGRMWKLKDDNDDDKDTIDNEDLSCVENNNAQEKLITASLDKKRLQDIQILGVTMIFYSLLQMTLQYLSEFYVDDLRDANGLASPTNFSAVSVVIANVFNGVNGGLALSTAIFAGPLVRTVWSGESKFVLWFLVSIITEALVTSGVIHSFAHRLFGTTLDGNSYVEFFSHVGYTINVIVTAILMIGWLAPSHLRGSNGNSPGWYPRPMEIGIAIIASILAVLFTQRWVPYEPDPEDFDHGDDHQYNISTIVFLQGNVQGTMEGLLLIPTVLLLFVLRRLWTSIRSSLSHDSALKLSFETFRICILSVAVPLCFNWIHFRCHDDLVRYIQPAFGWEHYQTIAAIRMVFHVPLWILSIARFHFFRLLTEERGGWSALDIIETICPGREIFPFAMIFLYRASEGMTIALLPSFFQGESNTEYFYLDVAEDTWVAVTVLGMFVGNAIGAVALGLLMQRRGYEFAYTLMCAAFMVVFLLYLIPHSNVSFFMLRSISAILFPGPVVLSRVTQKTRKSFTGIFKHIPMVVSLVWFNQGFWFGGIISNSSVWTPWNCFFTSAVVLFALFTCLLIAFILRNKKNQMPRGSTSVAWVSTPCDVAETGLLAEDIPNCSTIDPQYRQGNLRDLSQRSANLAHEGFLNRDNDSVSKNGDKYETDIWLDNDTDCKETIPIPSHHSGEDGDNPANTLLLARLASFANGASFACHISLLPIQVTQLVDLDVYEYTTIVSSLGGVSTVLILLCFRALAGKETSFSMAVAYLGHMIGTAVLCIPQLYTLSLGLSVACIVISYGAILLSFFVMNLSCEVSLGQKSLKQKNNKDAAAGLQMGLIKSFLSIGKVFGAAMVAFAFRYHPQLPLWILEGLLLTGALLTTGFHCFRRKNV